jgi:hypothetical protein
MTDTARVITHALAIIHELVSWDLAQAAAAASAEMASLGSLPPGLQTAVAREILGHALAGESRLAGYSELGRIAVEIASRVATVVT